MLKAMFEAAKKTKHLSDRLAEDASTPAAEKASGTSSESGPGQRRLYRGISPVRERGDN